MVDITGVHPYADKLRPGRFDPTLSEDPQIRAGQLKVAAGIARGFGSNPKRAPQFVYFIQSGSNGPIKIGAAASPLSRLRELQTGNPAQLTMLGVEPGGSSRERELHQRFSAHRLGGEWFAPANDLLAYIAAVAA